MGGGREAAPIGDEAPIGAVAQKNGFYRVFFSLKISVVFFANPDEQTDGQVKGQTNIESLING